MKVFIHGDSVDKKIENAVRNLGFEPLLLENSNDGKGREASEKTMVIQSDAVICDMNQKLGIIVHWYAYSEGKPCLSVRKKEQEDRPLSPNIELMSTLAHFSDYRELELIIGEYLNGDLKSKESELNASKERR